MTARRLIPGLAMALAVSLACEQRASAQARVRPGGNRAAPRVADSAQKDIAGRQVYDQLLLRDRRSRQMLDRARRELTADRIPEGLELLQHLLDRPGDGFVWLDDAAHVSSLRLEAHRLLTGGGRDVIDTYERLYGIEADRLLQEARRTGATERFRDVTRRFFHTKAGFEAADWLASRWLDRGEYASAGRIWSRLRDDPVHQPRVTPELVAKVALAWHLAGEPGQAQRAIESLAAENLRIGGRAVSLDGWLAGLDDGPAEARDGDWLLYLGSADRVRPVQATTPYPQPIWTLSFAENQPDSLLRLLDQWESLQAANLQPVAIATHPLVVGDLVIVRDWAGVRAVSIATGRSTWRYDSPMSLAEASERKTVFDRAYQRRGLTVAPTAQPELSIKYALAENSLQGTLSSDGERVYAVELSDVRWPRSAGRLPNVLDESRSRSSNQLIALPLRALPSRPTDGPRAGDAGQSVRPLWSVGGPAPEAKQRPVGPLMPPGDAPADGEQSEEPAAPDASLAGHYFLGAPLPLDGLLYALTEVAREVKLVVIEPQTGHPLWTQTLAGVDLPIEVDVSRHFRGCTPSYGGGVLVCPTGNGLLIALDPLDGTLLWSRFCGDALLAGQPVNRRGVISQAEHGHGGFNAAPQVHASRVVYLPPESESVFCLDLTTGNVCWTIPRVDGEYIGAVTDDLVLVVGSEFCRGVAFGNGEPRWQMRHGTPSGRGLFLGDRYLLPLEGGRVATIDLGTGREVGNSRAVAASRLGSYLGGSTTAAIQDEWLPENEAVRRPGNLVAASGRIVSVGARGMAVFRETGVLRKELEGRLRRQPGAVADQLLAAELELIEGGLDAAESLLTGVLSSRPQAADQDRAEGLLRELLYLRLDAGKLDEPAAQARERVAAILTRLEPLSQTRPERGRFLLRRALLALEDREVESVLDAVREFAALDSEQLLAHPENPNWRISASRWPQTILSRLAEQAGERVQPILQARLAAESDAALDSTETRDLEGFLSVWASRPGAAPARLELARRLIDRGRLHEAELLLLGGRSERRPDMAAESTHRLAAMWNARGLGFDAAALLEELGSRFADVKLADGRTGRESAGQFAAGPATELAFTQQSAESASVGRVRVSERLWWQIDPRLTAVYRTHTPAYVTPVENPLQVLVSRTESGTGQISVMNHAVGRIVNTVSLPMATAYPTFARTAYVGHFFPMGDVGSVSGVSLLESWRDRPMWTTTPLELAGRTEVIRVGPAGPTFCAIQARRYLGVLDPGDGQILWERTDVNPAGDAAFETSDTVIGDDQVLVVFSADRLQYVVYETASGRELRRGALDLDTRQVQRSFGRRLVYLSSQPGGRRLKIWDPLTDSIEYESEAADLLISTSINERELAFVLPSKPTGRAGLRPFSRLLIVDVPAAEVRVDIDLGAERLMHLNYLRAFRDDERYYVNFQRAIANRGVRHYSYFATDTYLPSEHMQGDLYAIDARSGEVLWNRVIPQRSFLRLPGARLPFLIGMARARDRWNGGQQSLVLEAFDARTGETLGWKDDIFADRLGQFACDPEQRRLELSGQHTTIRLDFGPELIRFPTGDEPF